MASPGIGSACVCARACARVCVCVGGGAWVCRAEVGAGPTNSLTWFRQCGGEWDGGEGGMCVCVCGWVGGWGGKCVHGRQGPCVYVCREGEGVGGSCVCGGGEGGVKCVCVGGRGYVRACVRACVWGGAGNMCVCMHYQQPR